MYKIYLVLYLYIQYVCPHIMKEQAQASAHTPEKGLGTELTQQNKYLGAQQAQSEGDQRWILLDHNEFLPVDNRSGMR